MKIFLGVAIFIGIIKNTVQICNEKNCPSESGECISDLCLCAPGYTTYIKRKSTPTKNIVFCNYALKYKDWAMWFELCLPFGVGHFYSRRYFHGFLKFTLFWFLSFVKVLFKKRVRGYPNLLKVSQILLWCFGILYCVDYFGFTFDYYTDGNKMKMIK